MSKLALDNKKKEIKDEIYNKMETFVQSIIERILDIIDDKISEKIEELWKNYKKKKKIKNGEIDNNDSDEEENKENKNNSEENEEENAVCTKVKSNQINGGEEEITIPDLNSEEINKIKEKKIENEDDNESDDDNNQISEEQKKKKEERKKKKEEKEKKIKEKAKPIIDQTNLESFFKESCQFGLELGIKELERSVIIPKIITVLSNWFKEILKNKLLPELMERFDEFLKYLGENVIYYEKNYNIKYYMDKILYSIEISFHIITGIKTFIIPTLKETLKKFKEEKKELDKHQIISDLDDKLNKNEEKVLTPMKKFINNVFGDKNDIKKYELYEKIIEEGYKKARKIGIEKYNEKKKNVNDKYEEYKKLYQNEKKLICDLPENLDKKYKEMKNEYIKKYDEKKKQLIETIDKIINDLKKKNLIREFKKIMRKIKDFVINQINLVKNKSKDIIKNISSIVPNYIDKFIPIIEAILKLNFGPFDEKKNVVTDHILNFFIAIESGQIEIKHENEKKETIYENGEQLLIKYLNEKLNLDKKTITEITIYLLKNGLKSILKTQINKVFNYIGNKIFSEKDRKEYETILNDIKEKYKALSNNISKFADQINIKVDSVFDYLIKFLNQKYKYITILDFYLNDITFSENFQDELLDYMNELKKNKITELSTKFEEKMKELNEKVDKNLGKIKKKATNKINKKINKAEKKVFKYINNILKDEQEKKKEEKSNIEEEESSDDNEDIDSSEDTKEKNTEKEKNKSNYKKENNEKNENNDNNENNKNNKNKNKKKQKKTKKKVSQFDIFDNLIHKKGENIDKKICDKACEFEKNFINYAKGSKARKYLRKKYSDDVKKSEFDDCCNSTEKKKEEGKNYINSKNVIEKCKKLDKFTNKIICSEKTEKVTNFIDNFDIKRAYKIKEEAKEISLLLDCKEIEDFKKNAKSLIEKKLYNCYDTYLEPQIKETIINLCKEIFDYIDKRRKKRKNKKNKKK